MTVQSFSLPELGRIQYAKSPLVEVTCEVRFPNILRIEAEAPADFQDRVRHVLPLFEQGQQIEMPDAPPDLVRALRKATGSKTVYTFLDHERKYAAGLTQSSLSLTTKHYDRWATFRGMLDILLGALTDVYRPSFFVRVGLRYIDLIRRSRLGIPNRPWSSLIAPHVLGELIFDHIAASADHARREIRFTLPDGTGRVFLRHGLAHSEQEMCYLMDFDLFADSRIEIADAPNRLDGYNKYVLRLFKWCIERELDEAMEPGDILPIHVP